jgi:hypothetical protein
MEAIGRLKKDIIIAPNDRNFTHFDTFVHPTSEPALSPRKFRWKIERAFTMMPFASQRTALALRLGAPPWRPTFFFTESA